MIEQIKRDDIPKSVDRLIQFWTKEATVENLPPETIKKDILAYLGWCGYLIGEVERLDIAASIDVSLGNTVAEMNKQIDKLQKALEWYADEANYKMIETQINEYSSETTSAAWTDSGERARLALERSETK